MARSLRVAKCWLFVLLALLDKVSTYPAKVPSGEELMEGMEEMEG